MKKKRNNNNNNDNDNDNDNNNKQTNKQKHCKNAWILLHSVFGVYSACPFWRTYPAVFDLRLVHTPGHNVSSPTDGGVDKIGACQRIIAHTVSAVPSTPWRTLAGSLTNHLVDRRFHPRGETKITETGKRSGTGAVPCDRHEDIKIALTTIFWSKFCFIVFVHIEIDSLNTGWSDYK